MFKVVFGERTKFIERLPRNMEELKILTGRAFKIIDELDAVQEVPVPA